MGKRFNKPLCPNVSPLGGRTGGVLCIYPKVMLIPKKREFISRVFVLVFPFVGSKISKKMMFFSLSLNWMFKEKLRSVSF